MYVVLEYLTYITLVAILAGLLFLVTGFILLTAAATARLSDSFRNAAARPSPYTGEEFSASKPVHHATPENS
jgi:hypothetical protein